MPKSRTRKLTYGQRVKGAMKRYRIEAENRPKVMALLELGLPHHQAYPSLVSTAIRRAVRTQQPSKPVPVKHAPGSIVSLANDRQYEVQRDGSWKRVRA